MEDIIKLLNYIGLEAVKANAPQSLLEEIKTLQIQVWLEQWKRGEFIQN